MRTSAPPLGARLCTRWGPSSPLLSNCAGINLCKVHRASGLPGCSSLKAIFTGHIARLVYEAIACISSCRRLS